jgi:RHS repeat-associated protein
MSGMDMQRRIENDAGLSSMRLLKGRHLPYALLVIAVLWLLANAAVAQTQTRSNAAASEAAELAVRSADTSSTAGAAVNVTGFWRGSVNNGGGDPDGALWDDEFNLHQDANGNVTGTRKTIPLQTAADWILWSVTGTVSGNTLNLRDTTVLQQGNPQTQPCAITATTTVSTDGNSFNGTWTAASCTGEMISGTRYGADPAKNLGDGGRCDGGEGAQGAGGSSGSGGGASAGTSCPEKNGAPKAGDPINTSTGNKFLQEDDFVVNPWLTFRRFYNSSMAVASANIGANWRHSFDRSLQIFGSPVSTIAMLRPDGTQENFTKSNGVWTTELNADVLTEIDNTQGVATSYNIFIGATRHIESYDTTGKLLAVTDESGQGIKLTYSTSTTLYSIAPRAGLLLTVTDPDGRQLSFTYYSNAKISKVTLPDGGTLKFSYDLTTGNMLSVVYPDGKTRQYDYNESSLTGGANLPNAMTGIIDENSVRYESTAYDSTGRATSSTFAGNVGTTQIAYNSDGTSSVTYPLGHTTNFGFSTPDGLVRVGTVDQPCGQDCGQPWQARAYDGYGYPASATDFKGNIYQSSFDSYGLLDQQVDALGTINQRTTKTNWDNTLRLPLSSTVQDANSNTLSATQWVYNTMGEPLARCDIDPASNAASGYTCSSTGAVPAGVRRWTYTYCSAVDTVQCPLAGLILTVTGPRTDLTQTTAYSYYMTSSAVSCGTPGAACYKAGDLHTITDALGHVTTISSYDADGRITRVTDANGVNTDMTYTARGWLASRSVGGATTKFTYMPYGAVQTVTDPDGITTTYGYDTAHRLNKVTDALGNYIQYALDAAGNKTGEQVYDASGGVHKQLIRKFNALGQLTTVIDGLNNTVFNATASGSYDASGNLVQSSDTFGIQRQLGYDALNRLVKTIDNYNGSDSVTKNTTIGYQYDGLNRLTQVTDPSSLNTTYSYDGLSNATGQVSPDTGSTNRSFDAAGNPISRIDARGVVVQYAYDALNRLTNVIYPAEPSLNISYTYDQATPISGCPNNFNIGHLTTMTDISGTTSWCYTNQGDISEVRQVVNNTVYLHVYAYTSARRLTYLQYPSGFELEYSYDADGRVSTIGYLQQLGPYGSYINSTLTPLITSVSYLPFGPVSEYSYAQNGQSVTRTYDANYRLTDLVSIGLTLHFLRDAKGRIQAEGSNAGASPASETYQYDPLDRLTTVLDANGNLEEGVSYNQAGDRLSKVTPQGTQSYGYNSGTHQLINVGGLTRSVDATGNITAMTDPTGELVGLGYDDTNRLTAVTSGNNTIANYQYNGEGQRVWQTITEPSAGQAATIYDPTGKGDLLGEYFASDYREYVYLNGIVVANATDAGNSAPSINYLYADHLGTLRAAVTTAGMSSYNWPWLNNAFGEQLPSGTASFYTRFPGQYYAVETGLSFNSNRFYDSGTGRYLESDPLGMFGGQINTYAYANGNPFSYVDPFGLNPGEPFHTPSGAAIDVLNFLYPITFTTSTEYSGVIYKSGDSYYATIPQPGTYDSSSVFSEFQKGQYEGANGTPVGMYHTHPYIGLDEYNIPFPATKQNTNFLSNCFSQTDFRVADAMSKQYGNPGSSDPFTSYLGTPETIRTYTPSAGTSGQFNYSW